MKKNNSFLSFLNSSFIVTVLGGLILSYVTNEWQQIDIENKTKQETLRQEYLLKKNILNEFTEIVPGSLFSLLRYKQREFWIESCTTIKKKTDFKAPDNRNFKETLAIYEKEQENYFTKRMPVTILSKIQGTYTQGEITESSKSLIDLFKFAVDSTSMEDFKKNYSSIDDQYFLLITLLSKEINLYVQ